MELKKVKQLIKVFEDSSLLKMEIEVDDIKLRMEKPSENVVVNSFSVPTSNNPFKVESENKKEEKKDWIKSPLVGTFYSASSPQAKPFVKVGDKVKEGDTICIIEAMKVMNEIKAPKSGYITEIRPKNGELVGFDDELMAIGEKA